MLVCQVRPRLHFQLKGAEYVHERVSSIILRVLYQFQTAS